MKRIFQISLILLLTAKAEAFERTNALGSSSDWASALGLTPAGLTNLIASLNSVADLGAQFNWNTNESAVSDFDKQICDSLPIKSKIPMMVAFKEVSLVFHFPNKLGLGSTSEMAGLPNLTYNNGKISRTNTDEQAALSCIRIFDPGLKEPTAEVNVLLGLAPVGKPNEVKYFHRSFWFVRKKIWERQRHVSND